MQDENEQTIMQQLEIIHHDLESLKIFTLNACIIQIDVLAYAQCVMEIALAAEARG